MKKSEFGYGKFAIPRSRSFIEDLNYVNKVNPEELIAKSEENYRNQIDELVNDFCEDKRKKIMLIAGPSSAGKTTSTFLINQRLEKRGYHTISLSLDDFFLDMKDRKILSDGSIDFESIYTLDLKYFGEFIDTIIDTGKAKMPHYDFLTGQRKKEYTDVEMKKGTVLLIEGLHALNPALIRGHNAEIYKTYISLNTDFYYQNKLILPARDLRLMRRCLRDYHSRNVSVETSFNLWRGVLQGEDVYIKPYKPWADYIVDSTHHYEPFLYAKYLLPLLKGVKVAKSISLKEILKLFQPIDKAIVPDESLVWEFLVHE